MWKNMKKALSIHKKASASEVFVSVNITDTMRTHGLSRQSTREIIRISVGSLLIMGLFFIVIYTILLAYVDNKLRPSPNYHDRSWKYKKLKLVGKKSDSAEPLGYVWQYSIKDRKIVWNSTNLYSGETLPRCELRSVFRIIITSSPMNSDRRQQIRKTWCTPENFNSSSHSWQCVFLVSRTDNEVLNGRVKTENKLHRDILLGSFVDSYRNLTFKVVHGLDWFINHCPSSYVIKTDDDCFVNSGVVLDFLLNFNKVTTNLYAGSFVTRKERLEVIRGDDSKWSVSHEDFPFDFYPPYASGIGYILSVDTARRFIRETRYIKPIVNEDAYVGIVMSYMGVQPTISSRFLLSPSGLSVCNFLYVMITHSVEPEKQAALLQTAIQSRTLCTNAKPVKTWN